MKPKSTFFFFLLMVLAMSSGCKESWERTSARADKRLMEGTREAAEADPRVLVRQVFQRCQARKFDSVKEYLIDSLKPKDLCQRVEKMGVEAQVLSVTVKEQSGELIATVIYDSPESYGIIYFYLRKEGGKWRIRG